MDFNSLNIDATLISGLEKQGIVTPTPVQEMSIPLIMQGKDTVVRAETSSGKTLAYLLPIYQNNLTTEKGLHTIILVPVHELAMQVHTQIELLSKNSGVAIKSTPIIGDVKIKNQIEKLKTKPQIVVGTCDRIIELIKLKKIPAHLVKTIVIDEADKMLSSDNIDSVKAVCKACMRDTQIVMMSASFSDTALETASLMLKSPEIIKVTDTETIPQNIKHIYFVCDEREKIDMLRKVVSALKPAKALVFINNADKIETATSKLQFHKYNADCLYGANVGKDRKQVIGDFTSGKLQFLIATDIAARGLHVEDITCVISLSTSQYPTDYLHRSGRTGRNNSDGLSISLVTKEEVALIKKYERRFNIEIQCKKLSEGKII